MTVLTSACQRCISPQFLDLTERDKKLCLWDFFFPSEKLKQATEPELLPTLLFISTRQVNINAWCTDLIYGKRKFRMFTTLNYVRFPTYLFKFLSQCHIEVFWKNTLSVGTCLIFKAAFYLRRWNSVIYQYTERIVCWGGDVERKPSWCRQTRVLSNHVLRFGVFNHPQSSAGHLTWRLEKWLWEACSLWGWLSKWLASRCNPSTFCPRLLPFGGSCPLGQNGKRVDCGPWHWLEHVGKHWHFQTSPISLFPGKPGRKFWECSVHTMLLLPKKVPPEKGHNGYISLWGVCSWR